MSRPGWEVAAIDLMRELGYSMVATEAYRGERSVLESLRFVVNCSRKSAPWRHHIARVALHVAEVEQARGGAS